MFNSSKLFYLEPKSSSSSSSCFPSEAKVQIENGKSVVMSELQIGDRVQTGISIDKN